jgi:hypothetical protein
VVLQPLQATGCSGSHCLEASSGMAQSEAGLVQLKAALKQPLQIGMAASVLAQGLRITLERALKNEHRQGPAMAGHRELRC